MKKIIFFIFSLIICFSAAAVGSYFTTPFIPGWYAGLNKPFFNPPNWIFAPVWTVLYLTMAVSLYLVWSTRSNKKEKKIGIKLFFLQLSLNCLWSILFFGMQLPLVALLEIIVLWLMIYLTIANFWQVKPVAGKILLPYIIWVSFASILNLSIVILNK